MSEPKIRRLIRAFDRKTDEFVWEVEVLPAITLVALQNLLSVEAGNPMYDAFPITVEQAEMLADLEGIELAQRSLDLFVEAEAADE